MALQSISQSIDYCSGDVIRVRSMELPLGIINGGLVIAQTIANLVSLSPLVNSTTARPVARPHSSV
jgi:hypothetical protein